MPKARLLPDYLEVMEEIRQAEESGRRQSRRMRQEALARAQARPNGIGRIRKPNSASRPRSESANSKPNWTVYADNLNVSLFSPQRMPYPMTMELPKHYDPREAQKRWLRFWNEHGFFHARPDANREPFCIVIPPPNVTGALHLGHALNNTLQDVLVRWRRMQGYNALWMPGTDHAGIATQAVVERRLREERKDAPRPRPRRAGQAHLAMEGPVRNAHPRPAQRTGLQSAIGSARASRSIRSAPRRPRRRSSRCSRTADLPRQTAGELGHATANVGGRRRDVHRDSQGRVLDVPLSRQVASRTRFIRFSTTRPETMLGDTAVAVHPERRRYKHLIGKIGD